MNGLESIWRGQTPVAMAQSLRGVARLLRMLSRGEEIGHNNPEIDAEYLDYIARRLEHGESLVGKDKKALIEELETYFENVSNLELPRGTIPVRGAYVYILEDVHHRPLYVGQSGNLLARLGAHLREKLKRRRVRTVRWIKCEDESEALDVERYLIVRLQPPFNKTIPSYVVGPDEADEWASEERTRDDAAEEWADRLEHTSRLKRTAIAPYLGDNSSRS